MCYLGDRLGNNQAALAHCARRHRGRGKASEKMVPIKVVATRDLGRIAKHIRLRAYFSIARRYPVRRRRFILRRLVVGERVAVSASCRENPPTSTERNISLARACDASQLFRREDGVMPPRRLYHIQGAAGSSSRNEVCWFMAGHCHHDKLQPRIACSQHGAERSVPLRAFKRLLSRRNVSGEIPKISAATRSLIIRSGKDLSDMTAVSCTILP